MQHLISLLWTKAKRCFPQKTERPHSKSGSSWSQQPARGSPNYKCLTETSKEEGIHRVSYTMWKRGCSRLTYPKQKQTLEPCSRGAGGRSDYGYRTLPCAQAIEG